MIFPKGVPLFNVDSAGRSAFGSKVGRIAKRDSARPTSAENEISAVTTSEGNLSSKSKDVHTGRQGVIPEAEENLLTGSNLETGAAS